MNQESLDVESVHNYWKKKEIVNDTMCIITILSILAIWDVKCKLFWILAVL